MSSVKKADVAKKATELEGKLKGKMFLGGDRPTEADVAAFHELLGTENLGLYRWVKHIASFTDAERKLWDGKEVKKEAPKEVKKDAPKEAKKQEAKKAEEEEIDLFGEETEEEAAALEAKKKADAEKKKAKPAVIAKSSILIDIKPWDDETNLKELGEKLKAVERDGLLWGAQKLVPVAYGVNKLQQLLVIEDDKISGDDLEDIITGFEDYVQSMDIVAWNKV